MSAAAAVQTRPDALEELHGLIERVTFHNAETGFALLRRVRGRRVYVRLPSLASGRLVKRR